MLPCDSMWHSPSSDSDDDEYTKRTRLNFLVVKPVSNLSLPLQKTHALLENFSRDVKRAWSSLLNRNKPIPQFPQAEWLNLLSGNAIDLDHVFQHLHGLLSSSCSMDLPRKNSQDSRRLGYRMGYIGRSHSFPLFSCLCTGNQLQSYCKRIQRYFPSLPSQYHSRVINYDRAAVSKQPNVEMSNSPISLSSLTYKFSGSATRQSHLWFRATTSGQH